MLVQSQNVTNTGRGTFEQLEHGFLGAIYVDHTNAVVGEYAAILALEATTIASLAGMDLLGTLTSIPLPSGTMIKGHFTSFRLTSGKVWAYRE